MAHLTGLIVIWRGAIADIPHDWILCDGTLGTPDLTDRFVIGAGDSFAVGDRGGSVSHSHTFTGDGHFHTLELGSDINSGFNQDREGNVEPGIGTTDLEGDLPPYYALAYIMKT